MIAENSIVVVVMHDEKAVFKSNHMLKVSGMQKLFKKQVDVTPLVGKPFGSIFELVGNKLERINDKELFDFEDMGEFDDGERGHQGQGQGQGQGQEPVKESSSSSSSSSSSKVDRDRKGDNRNINDTNTAQKMSNKDIAELKEQGLSGTEIIQKLVKNSGTWDLKTEFSQEKWLKKKKKKYLQRFRVIESTPISLCEVYNIKGRDKICCIRVDSLAHIISHSGVHAGGRVLIFESVLGLIVGSVALRMAGDGRIVALYAGQQPRAEIADFLNLDDESASIVMPASTVELGPAVLDVQRRGFYSPQKRKFDELTKEEQTIPPVSALHGPSKRVTRPFLRTNRQVAEGTFQMRQWLREGFSSLIIASKYDPLPVLKQALYLLGPSSPIVIHSEHVEPLNECFLYLQNCNLAIKLTISENWLRPYQTLPGRVHPHNYMSSTGGFVLTGVTTNALRRGEEGEEKEKEKV